jgi:hypothetical protein
MAELRAVIEVTRPTHRTKTAVRAGWFAFGMLSWPCYIGIYQSVWQHQLQWVLPFLALLLLVGLIALSVRYQCRIYIACSAAVKAWKDNPNAD